LIFTIFDLALNHLAHQERKVSDMELQKNAIFSPCRKYRYVLWRQWDKGVSVVFIGLNPSTADETKDDPTIRRCIGYAKEWGYSGVFMLNIFAYRSTNPKDLRLVEEPIGSENDNYLKRYLSISLNVACWGIGGSHESRGQKVIELLGRENLMCLGQTKDGHPKHPLYLKRGIEPVMLRGEPSDLLP